MELQTKGHNVDVGDALRSHVETALSGAVGKYFENAVSGDVTFSKEAGHRFQVDIKVHPKRGMVVHGSANGDDAYGAFDGALERIAKQLRRYKRRLTNHHKTPADEVILKAQQYVIQGDESEEELPEASEPVIVAEMDAEIVTVSVGEAVMRMDLAGTSVMMFRNSTNQRLNVVYRREDGNIGWIDPVDEPETR